MLVGGGGERLVRVSRRDCGGFRARMGGKVWVDGLGGVGLGLK